MADEPNGKQPERSRLFGADGQPVVSEHQLLDPMHEGGFQLPLPTLDVHELLKRCAVPVEIAPGVRQQVAQIRPDVALCWASTVQGLLERDERLDAMEEVIDALCLEIEGLRKKLGMTAEPEQPGDTGKKDEE